MSYLRYPHLPTRPITAAIVSCQLPLSMRRTLGQYGIHLFECPSNPALPVTVNTHPDLSVFDLGSGRMIVAKELPRFLPESIEQVTGTTNLSPNYPQDIAYDACLLGTVLFCKKDATAPEILQQPYSIVDVRQGYAKCSIAIVSATAAITEDKGLAQAMRNNDIDVLELEPGGVALPGYDRGFIGGSCGKIAPDILAFFGDVSRHPQHKQMVEFCAKYGVTLLSIGKEALTDYGSLLPITE